MEAMEEDTAEGMEVGTGDMAMEVAFEPFSWLVSPGCKGI